MGLVEDLRNGSDFEDDEGLWGKSSSEVELTDESDDRGLITDSCLATGSFLVVALGKESDSVDNSSFGLDLGDLSFPVGNMVFADSREASDFATFTDESDLLDTLLCVDSDLAATDCLFDTSALAVVVVDDDSSIPVAVESEEIEGD